MVQECCCASLWCIMCLSNARRSSMERRIDRFSKWLILMANRYEGGDLSEYSDRRGFLLRLAGLIGIIVGGMLTACGPTFRRAGAEWYVYVYANGVACRSGTSRQYPIQTYFRCGDRLSAVAVAQGEPIYLCRNNDLWYKVRWGRSGYCWVSASYANSTYPSSCC